MSNEQDFTTLESRNIPKTPVATPLDTLESRNPPKTPQPTPVAPPPDPVVSESHVATIRSLRDHEAAYECQIHCTASLAIAVEEAGGRFSYDMLNMSVMDFIINVASKNGIRFVFDDEANLTSVADERLARMRHKIKSLKDPTRPCNRSWRDRPLSDPHDGL